MLRKGSTPYSIRVTIVSSSKGRLTRPSACLQYGLAIAPFTARWPDLFKKLLVRTRIVLRCSGARRRGGNDAKETQAARATTQPSAARRSADACPGMVAQVEQSVSCLRVALRCSAFADGAQWSWSPDAQGNAPMMPLTLRL